MRFRAEQRLRRQLDFRATRERGRRFDCGGFTFWYHRRAEEDAVPSKTPAVASVRVGVVASTAAVGNAVERNRAKRRMRELFRAHQQRIPAGYDVLLVAKRSLNGLPYPQIEQRFVDACTRLFGGAA